MIEAGGDHITEIRFAHTHDRVGAAPIDLYGCIGHGNRATGEHDIVNLSRDFPRIFRLQDPRIVHPDDFRRVLQVMQSHPQAGHAAHVAAGRVQYLTYHRIRPVP